MSTRTWLCAYAITRNRDEPVPGAPRLVGHRDLALVVDDVDPARFDRLETDDSALAELVCEHDAVVRAVFRYEPVLPLRFGTILDGEDAARRLLQVGYEQAQTRLGEIDAHQEWGVRVRRTESAEPAPRPDSAGLTGTEYLARRREKVQATQRSRDDLAARVEHLREVLQGLASDSTDRTRAPGVLVDSAYLVPAAGEAAFHAEIRRLEADFLGATVETTGPWPPYSFTGLQLGVVADG